MQRETRQPRLRLVGSAPPTDHTRNKSAAASPMNVEAAPARLRAGEARAARAINFENRAAANPDIDPTDPRWVLAARVYSQLDGAALSPDRRDKVMKLASKLGIRPFDASVIVALVQDRARRGGSLRDITTTLQMMPHSHGRDRGQYLWRWMTAIASAAVATAFLIQWLLAG